MSKHLLYLSTRPAAPRIVAIPHAAPLVRGLTNATRRTIKESVESTIHRGARLTVQPLWGYLAFGFGIGIGISFCGSIFREVYESDKRHRSGSQARLADSSSTVPITSSQPSRSPPPAAPASDSPPTMKSVAPSTLQFQFSSPPSRALGSSGSSVLCVHTSSSFPFTRFSEFSPGSLDSLLSPGIRVLADAQSLNDRLRAFTGARSSTGSSDGEDVERGSDNGSDGSWEAIVEG